MVLHNICLSKGDTMPMKLNLTIDPSTNEKRDSKGERTSADVELYEGTGFLVSDRKKFELHWLKSHDWKMRLD